ncbi:MAG: alpha/beta hydrolase [Lentisphaeraceae bacterium]|nr:alpha/beta hydrolase [Lentisphaeraceae bacterium]
MNCQSTELACSWGKTFVRQWNAENKGAPILAIHGWQDNSASFANLAKHLNQRIIAIDLPGHGFSDHLPAGNWYHFVDYVVRLNEVITKLDLQKFIIIGHSLGAGISLVYASIFPEQIDRIVLLDGVGPAVNTIEEAPEILYKSILARNRTPKTKKLLDLDTAIRLRMTAGEISHESAETLIKGQLKAVGDKFEFTYDPKVKLISPLRMSLDHLRVFYKKIQSEVLLIIASRGLIENNPDKQIIDEIIPSLTKKAISGGHHVHMDSAKETAFLINSFLNS